MDLIAKLWAFPALQMDISRSNAQKLLRIMKLISFLILIGCISVSANTLAQKVTLNVKDAPVKTVLREVIRQTGISIVYDEALLAGTTPVTLKVKGATVEEVLKKSFENQPLGFKLEGSKIVIHRIAAPPLPGLLSRETFALKDINGRVIDEENKSLVGASVKIKGSASGTVTNADGTFTLKANEGDILVITYVGHQTKEIRITAQNFSGDFISITLPKVPSHLDQAVVIAYGTTTIREMTGAVGSLKAAEIEKQPVINLALSLHGRIPGVVISQSSGMPGSSVSIRVRERTTLSSGQEPLVIVDGVPYPKSVGYPFSGIFAGSNTGNPIGGQGADPLGSIDPNDIESIEVLKDADATAIYGSRGANGVVLITTKKAKAGDTKVSVNFSHGFNRIERFLKLLNTKQYLEMRNEAFSNDNVTKTVGNAPDLLLWDTTRNTDWQRELLGGTGHTNNASVALSGGDNNTQYTLRAAYFRQSDIVPKKWLNQIGRDFYYQRASGHLNVRHSDVPKRFSLDVTIDYSIDDNNTYSSSGSGDVWRFALTLPPNAPLLYNADGGLNWKTGNNPDGYDPGTIIGGDGNGNPAVYFAQNVTVVNKNMRVNGVISYKLFNALTLRANLGYSVVGSERKVIRPKSSYAPNSAYQASLALTDGTDISWQIEPQAEFRKRLGGGTLTILAGAALHRNVNKYTFIGASGFSNDALIETPRAATSRDVLNSFAEYKFASLFGRFSYNYKGKYIAHLTGRRDGSSRFGPGKKFGNFGSIGTAYVFSEEKLVKKNMPFLSFGKLRVSYGTTGNDQITNYQYLDVYSAYGYQYQGATITPIRLANPNFSWEHTTKFDAGLDIGLFEDRLYLSVGMYHTRSTDQLVNLNLPYITGFSSIQFNMPAVLKGRGLEIEARGRLVQKKKFSWDMNLTLTIPGGTRVTEYPEFAKSPYYNSYVLGQRMDAGKRVNLVGVDPNTGLYVYEGIDGTQYQGSQSIPNTARGFTEVYGRLWYGGIGNNFSFGSMQLDVFMDYENKNTTDWARFGMVQRNPGTLGNQTTHVLNRWQKPGDLTDVQRFGVTSTTNTGTSRLSGSAGAGARATFYRIKNVAVSWNVPSEWTGRYGIKQVKLYAQGQNLFTFTDFTLNPENVSTYNMPPLRVLLVGVQLTL